jgi:hypothetical protein
MRFRIMATGDVARTLDEAAAAIEAIPAGKDES